MKKILFVCHGNICRSPMAEFVFKHLLAERGLADAYEVDSAATSTEEIGNAIYPPALRTLYEHGITRARHTARQMTKADYRYYDLVVAMDDNNLRNLNRMFNHDPDGKFHLLMDYTAHPHDVADPWYTGDFETTYRDILEGCTQLLRTLENA